MWPQALQMTRDECRGILRRLELESYSQVISVFRAQGGLSDAKSRLLEELRGIFHVSNERHRAEARRVANDEQLATIAEAISGPNTWQEWSREGRRPYPMLPRVAPQTALALLANNVAEETAQENSKLPYPADTAEAVKEEQLQLENQKSKEAVERTNYVVTNDPFKIPDIPQNFKKNLKRNSEQQNSGTGKKRPIGDNTANVQTSRKIYPHITANSPHTHSATSSMTLNSDRKQKFNATDQYLEKQRFFHRQHQITKQKMAKKAAAAAAAAANSVAMSGATSLKRQATPAKSGRRANQKLHQEQQKKLTLKQQQKDMQSQQQVPMQIDLTCGSGLTTTSGGIAANASQAILTQQQLDMQFVTYSTHHQPPQQIFKEKDIEMVHSQLSSLPGSGASTGAISVPISSSNQYPPSLITPLSSPQIAASKRDISKNFNKLQIQQNQLLSSNPANLLPSAAPMPSHDLQTSFGMALPPPTLATSSASDKTKSSEKALISTTPVQKYIVEERQPGIAINVSTCPNPSSLVNIQNQHGSASTQSHIIQVSNVAQQPQMMSFPQISAAATKLRAVNTTLIAPGSKIGSNTTKKITPGACSSSSNTIGGSSSINAGALHELANVASTQSQVLHILDTGGNNNPPNAFHGNPLHTPPAVIQIQNTAGSSTGSSSDVSVPSTHGKVLTTKILPLVLTGSGNQNNANNTLLNNSNLVMASSATSSANITSSTSTAAGSTIIKSLSSNMVLNTSTANLTPVTVTSTNNSNITTLGTGSSVFRKPPNIIKTSVSGNTPTKSNSSSSGPHIISNVKLTPVSVGGSSSGTHLTTANTFKNVLPSTSGMVRTSVKICQSPNGKVFIQPANLVDGSKMKLTTGTMPHKIISNTPTGNSSAITSSGQRIAIQKVQIIPAPVNSAVSGNPLQGAANQLNAKTGKSNMIFMPTSSTNVRPVTISKMGSNILLKSSASQPITPTSPTTAMAAVTSENTAHKSNIVVLGPPPTAMVKDQLSQHVKLENTQLINEDTPLDILNMPIVMEPGVAVTSSSSAAETVTVLQSNIIEAGNVSSPSSLAQPIILDQTQLHQPSKTVVLNVDWEMKLDIEQQNQYNNKNLKLNKRTLSTSSSPTASAFSTQLIASCTSSQGTKQKHLNSDYISMELNANDASHSTNVTTTTSALVSTTTATTTTSNTVNNMIVIDDSFDDVIVEEHEDDTSSITSFDKQQQQQNDNDIPKILDMQIYQQHDGHDNMIAPLKTNSNDDDVEIDVNDDEEDGDNKINQTARVLQSQESTRNVSESEQLHSKEHHQNQQFSQIESEIDAGFDETLVTEIDENTALEYIEEDGANANVCTTTTGSIATTLNKRKKMYQKVGTTTSTSIITHDEDGKTGIAIGNNHSVPFISNEKLTVTGISSCETLPIVPIITTTTANSIQETTTANNSATQQIEP